MKRRAVLALGLLGIPLRAAAQANAHVSTTDPLVYALTKGKTVNAGRVKLDLPKIADTGYSVPMTVRVESPMTPGNHVRAVHLIAEKNPMRDMASFQLGPHSARAEVGSNIRLNGSQRVVAIAEMSDGSFWSDAAYIEVREAACTEEG
jgi:sulfur-oxidizing protein SoxY